jgi:hypothetical protein
MARFDPFAAEKEAMYKAKKARAAEMAAAGQVIDSRGYIVAKTTPVAPVVAPAAIVVKAAAVRAEAFRMGNRCHGCGCAVGAEDFCAACG